MLLYRDEIAKKKDVQFFLKEGEKRKSEHLCSLSSKRGETALSARKRKGESPFFSRRERGKGERRRLFQLLWRRGRCEALANEKRRKAEHLLHLSAGERGKKKKERKKKVKRADPTCIRCSSRGGANEVRARKRSASIPKKRKRKGESRKRRDDIIWAILPGKEKGQCDRIGRIYGGKRAPSSTAWEGGEGKKEEEREGVCPYQEGLDPRLFGSGRRKGTLTSLLPGGGKEKKRRESVPSIRTSLLPRKKRYSRSPMQEKGK